MAASPNYPPLGSISPNRAKATHPNNSNGRATPLAAAAASNPVPSNPYSTTTFAPFAPSDDVKSCVQQNSRFRWGVPTLGPTRICPQFHLREHRHRWYSPPRWQDWRWEVSRHEMYRNPGCLVYIISHLCSCFLSWIWHCSVTFEFRSVENNVESSKIFCVALLPSLWFPLSSYLIETSRLLSTLFFHGRYHGRYQFHLIHPLGGKFVHH
jgi:hypothetical protein